LLAVFALENGWVWEGRGCDEKSALAFENKVDIVFLFVLLRDKIALGVDDFHEENFELLNHILPHCSKSRNIP